MSYMPIMFDTFKYEYDPMTNTASPGDYAKFELLSTEYDLIKHDDSINKATGKLREANQVTMGRIDLCIPVLNYVLAGKNGSFLRKILGFGQNDWDKILNCELVYSKLTKYEEIANGNMLARDVLAGSRYIAYLIEQFDIQEAIEDEILALFRSIFKGNMETDVFEANCGLVSIPSGDDHEIHVIGNYYITYEPELEQWLKRGYSIEDFTTIKNDYLKKFDNRLSLLLNLRDKSSLWAMIAPYVLVIPYEMRASMDGDVHTMHHVTKLYKDLMQCNSTMVSYYKNPQVYINEFKTHYSLLTQQLNRLMYECIDEKTGVDISLKGRMATKKGQVRLYNFGRRQDYSARAVVTVSPYLPLDYLNVPEVMLPSLYEYHVIPYLIQKLEDAKNDETSPLRKYTLADIHSTDPKRYKVMQKAMLDIIYEQNFLEKIPMYLGRQPTLHKHSLQAFHIGVSKTNAFQVSPLVCPGFNMDFDGDQGYVNVPLSARAQADVEKLLMTTQNIYLAKDGESTIEPRQDMLYGLYMATRDAYQTKGQNPPVAVADYHAVYDLVCNNKLAVWDKVVVGGVTMTAGDAAVIGCFKPGDLKPRGQSGFAVKEINKDTVKEFIQHLLKTDPSGNRLYKLGTGDAETDTFVGAINHLVKLGFKVAEYYPPNVSLIDATRPVNEIETDECFEAGKQINYDNINRQFYDSLKDADYYYNNGLDTMDTYREKFKAKATILKDAINSNVIQSLTNLSKGTENGYYLMAVSGGRGNKSNLAQIFKYKGQVQKDENHSFDAIIEHGYATQLTPLEAFVNAYGGRQGQMDKSLKTGDTGYAMREMWHATQGYVITVPDCGDTEGVDIDYNFFSDNFNENDKPDLIMAKWLEGHYLVGENVPITRERAKDLVNASKNRGTHYKLRSPMTCKKPCCQKCYGIDPATHKDAIIGLNVGLIAAQSIGEPATQLTMKQFQKGGVASDKNVTSAFDRVKAYLSMRNMTKNYVGYDPVAWATGDTHYAASKIAGMKYVWIGDDNTKAITVSTKFTVTPHAVKGVGLALSRGDYDMHELIERQGVDIAQKYLVSKLFSLYAGEVKIMFQHFEILAASLARYLILKTNRTDNQYDSSGNLIQRRLRVGRYATAQEYYAGSVLPPNADPKAAGTYGIKQLISIKDVIQASNDGLDEIQMENLGRGISHVTAMQLEDSFTKPLNRMVLSHSILTGSNLPNFIESRHDS